MKRIFATLHRSGFGIACALTLACAVLVPAQAIAQILAISGPVPTGPDDEIYGAANVRTARLSVSLTPFGYVEEEYFVSGKATAYWSSSSGLEPLAAGLPYTTRIVVRRPADAARFSGVVHFEPIHPTQGATFSWLALDRYLMSRGDVYVAVGLGNYESAIPFYLGNPAPIAHGKVTKWFNPRRYEALSWPEEDGIGWEVMSDIGRKLRSSDADNPLNDLDVRAMLVSGWSWTGSLQQVFINEGFHDRARLLNGRPVFDGYIAGVASALNEPRVPLHNHEAPVPLGDPRRTLKPIDGKVIEFLTELEVELGRNEAQVPDSDAVIGGHRVYELGGVIHVASLLDPSLSYPDMPNLSQLLSQGYPSEQVSSEPIDVCPVPQSDVPQGAFLRAVVENLRDWILHGTVPPRAEPLQWSGGTFARDATGNVLGGIRAAEFEVPLAQYGLYPGGDQPGCIVTGGYPFYVRNDLPREELIRRYRSADEYLSRYDRGIDRLVNERWLLEEDALRLRAKARLDARRQFGPM